MAFDLSHCDSFDRVWLHHAIDEVSDISRDVVRDIEFGLFDLIEELGHGVVIKRQSSTYHSK
jgi:hypothetical protein